MGMREIQNAYISCLPLPNVVYAQAALGSLNKGKCKSAVQVPAAAPGSGNMDDKSAGGRVIRGADVLGLQRVDKG